MRHLLCSILFLTLSCLVEAGPEPHGKRFILAREWSEHSGETDTGAAAVLPADATVVPLEDPAREAGLRELRERADAQELRYGPYGGELVETLVDLARLLDDAGDDRAALALRERALHLIRVNEGLYSVAQGPILRAILDSDRRRGDLEALDARYSYFFRLYGSGRAPYSELRRAAAMEYFAWQREALLLGMDRDPRGRLLDVQASLEELRRALLEDPSADWRYLRDLTLSQIATLYIVDDMIDVPDYLYDARAQRQRQQQGGLDFDPLQERLENLKRTLRGRGRTMLEEALERVPPGEIHARAELRRDLGDWLLWLGASRSAVEVYGQLWQDMGSAGLSGLRDDWFGAPEPLPAAWIFEYRERSASRVIGCEINVSDRGRVRISACGGPADRNLERLRGYLRTSRFRPAYADGVAVPVEGMQTSWRVISEE